jgi:excisionase family DNA binding protein
MPSKTKLQAQLLTAPEAAELLRVNVRTIHSWIEKDAIPYVALPATHGARSSYRIPLHGLLGSLKGTYDLKTEVQEVLQAADQSEEVLAAADRAR